jgi:hypothetical protein
MKTTPASRKPITDGMEETATINSDRGIQNHSKPNTPPVTIEAVGTTPSDRERGVSVVVTGGAGTASRGVVTATMSSTYGPRGVGGTAISPDSTGG